MQMLLMTIHARLIPIPCELPTKGPNNGFTYDDGFTFNMSTTICSAVVTFHLQYDKNQQSTIKNNSNQQPTRINKQQATTNNQQQQQQQQLQKSRINKQSGIDKHQLSAINNQQHSTINNQQSTPHQKAMKTPRCFFPPMV